MTSEQSVIDNLDDDSAPMNGKSSPEGRHKSVNAPEKVVLRDPIIEPELVEKARLIAPPPTHHRCLQGYDPQNQRNHCSVPTSRLFRQHRPDSEVEWYCHSGCWAAAIKIPENHLALPVERFEL
jgi:hypothetical protein